MSAHHHTTFPRQVGFSLIETLIVTTVIGIILKTKKSIYGEKHIAAAGAALAGTAPTHINSQTIAVNQPGADGDLWVNVH